METNWDLLEKDTDLLNYAIIKMRSEGIEPEKLKDIVEWVNSKPYPYPYQPERSKREDSRNGDAVL
jgi:hypothetical protein